MLRASSIMLLIACLFTGCGKKNEPDNQAAQTDHDRFQGTWSVVSLEVGGSRPDDKDADEMLRASVIVFDGDVIQTKFPKKSDRGRFIIDATRMPKEITVVWDAEKGTRSREDRGIYEFDGDILKVFNPPPETPRPISFDKKAGTVLLSLRRR
jgi:uncharacterized protein (TIGR03067 family)